MNTASYARLDDLIAMPDLITRPPYSWEPEYQEALLETDSNLLPLRIEKAERLMMSRRSALKVKNSEDEIHSLEDALRNLHILKNQA